MKIFLSVGELVQTGIIVVAGAVATAEYRRARQHFLQERTIHFDSRIDDLNRERMQIENWFPRKIGDPPFEVSFVKEILEEAKTDGGANLEIDLRTFLARLQILALAVNAEIVDYRFAFELLGSTIVRHGVGFRLYIESVRERNQQTLLYGDLLYLADQWLRELAVESAAVTHDGGKRPYYVRKARWGRRKRAITLRSRMSREQALSFLQASTPHERIDRRAITRQPDSNES
jgi:hypothetical protein